MSGRDTLIHRFEHADAQDDRVLIDIYGDIGIGPAVVFEGAGFMDPKKLNAFIADLQKASDWLANKELAVWLKANSEDGHHGS